MATLTVPQIAQLALNAGVPQGQQLYIAVAVALAESSGRTDAVNNNADGTKDVGVWQINDVHKMMWFGHDDDRTDPVANAKYMAKVSGMGMSWSPWTVYKTGAYNTHMQRVMSELQSVNLTRGTDIKVGTPPTLAGGYGVAPTITNVGNLPGLSDIKESYETIDKFFKFISDPDGWLRILKCGLGVILVITGVVLMMKSEVQRTVKTVAKVIA